MQPRHSKTVFQSRCLLVLPYIMLILTHIPHEANAMATDFLHSLEALGVSPKKVELSMRKLGERPYRSTHSGSAPSSSSEAEANGVAGVPFITHGDDAFPAQFKHQAAILINTSIGYFQICGGTVVSEFHVLTAAHCLPYLTGELNQTYDHFVAVGMLDLSLGLANPGSQIVPVSNYYIHDHYSPDSAGFPNDLAMLYMGIPITLNAYVDSAQLAHPSDGTFANTTCVVSGWGLTEDSYPNILQRGYQYITTKKDCINFWAISRRARITKRHICGYFHPIQICSGDSGGPLTCGTKTVVGLVSWGLANCSGCFPGVFTRISFHYWWIRSAMK